MQKKAIENQNLFVAEKLLKIITEKPNILLSNNYIKLDGADVSEILKSGKEDIYDLSDSSLIESLMRLEYRGAIKFINEEDKYDYSSHDFIELYLTKNKLIEFIEIAKDKLYKIPQEYKKKKELNYVLEALASFQVFLPKRMIEFSDLDNKYLDVASWIADYSGNIKILYDDEPDVEWKDLPRPQIMGVSAVPKSFVIIADPIKKLEEEIRKLTNTSLQKRISLFLQKNNDTDWRCASCGHFLQENLTEEKQISDYLNDFRVRKFRVCYKCRKRNYFSIDKNGKIKFMTTKKLPLSEIKKELEKRKKQKIKNRFGFTPVK